MLRWWMTCYHSSGSVVTLKTLDHMAVTHTYTHTHTHTHTHGFYPDTAAVELELELIFHLFAWFSLPFSLLLCYILLYHLASSVRLPCPLLKCFLFRLTSFPLASSVFMSTHLFHCLPATYLNFYILFLFSHICALLPVPPLLFLFSLCFFLLFFSSFSIVFSVEDQFK